MIPSYADVYAEIKARAMALRPDLTAVHRSQALNRQNWENLVNDGKLLTPYLIVESGGRRPMPFAMDAEAYAYSVALYLVTDLTPNAVEEDAAQMEGFATSFWQDGFRTFSLMNGLPTVDVTESNPANLVFYSLQAKKFAGMLSFEAIVGCGVYVEE